MKRFLHEIRFPLQAILAGTATASLSLIWRDGFANTVVLAISTGCFMAVFGWVIWRQWKREVAESGRLWGTIYMAMLIVITLLITYLRERK